MNPMAKRPMLLSERLPGVLLILMLILGGFSCHRTGTPQWIELFNGRDLSGWHPKITGYPLDDNFGNTFRVADGAIKVSYEKYYAFNERFGHIFYEKPFSHYIFEMEYRFTGDQAKGGPGWATRNSGIMLHCQDPKTMTIYQDFPISLEVQLLGGDGQNPRTTANLCTPGTQVIMEGRLISDHCISSHSDTYHGDQWVKVGVLVLGDSVIAHYINRKEVIRYENPTIGGGNVSNHDPSAKKDGQALSRGYISLQSESHPVEFKNIRLMDLEAFAHDRKKLAEIRDRELGG
jgi:hypothetical protein